MNRKVCMGAMFAALGGCVSAGTNFDSARLPELHAGQSMAEVNATLGKPNAVSHLADGRTIEVWSHVKANAFGASQARTASILFDRDGRMVRLTGESDVTGH